ncbi:hypothetical protein [Rhodoplanes roseus]|nr:hypothetical protein [Rhodoplanes roseus]
MTTLARAAWRRLPTIETVVDRCDAALGLSTVAALAVALACWSGS